MKTTRERRAYIILVGMSIGLSILMLIFCINIVNGANQRSCAVLQVVVLNPVPKPTGQITLSRERSYRRYLGYIALYRELQCHNGNR